MHPEGGTSPSFVTDSSFPRRRLDSCSLSPAPYVPSIKFAPLSVRQFYPSASVPRREIDARGIVRIPRDVLPNFSVKLHLAAGVKKPSKTRLSFASLAINSGSASPSCWRRWFSPTARGRDNTLQSTSRDIFMLLFISLGEEGNRHRRTRDLIEKVLLIDPLKPRITENTM